MTADCTIHAPLYVYLRCCGTTDENIVGKKIVCGMHRDIDNKEKQANLQRCDDDSLVFVPLKYCLGLDGRGLSGAGDIPTCQIVPKCHMNPLTNAYVSKLTEKQRDELTSMGR